MKYKKFSVKKYDSPIPEGVKTRIGHPIGPYAHKNFPESKYAKDFLIPVGTPIRAVEDGKVMIVKSDSNKYGLDPKFAKEVNYIDIENDKGIDVEYLHFGQNQILFKEGDKVKKGDILGYSGLSGWMDKPHLHMNRFKIENKKAISLPYDVRGFEETDEKSQTIKDGGLEQKLRRVAVVIFIISLGIALLFLSGITGNIIGITNNNLYGLIFVVVSLICGGVWVLLRKS